MAHTSSQSDETIAGINVTPLVDVVLVLLVVMMVTATYIASRAIPVELPRAASGEATSSPLSISIDREGALFLDGALLGETALRTELRARRARLKDLRAVIAADGAVPHRRVVHVIDLLRQEKIVRFAINVNPEDLARKP
jgi:biopolymer transport protein TolR